MENVRIMFSAMAFAVVILLIGFFIGDHFAIANYKLGLQQSQQKTLFTDVAPQIPIPIKPVSCPVSQPQETIKYIEVEVPGQCPDSKPYNHCEEYPDDPSCEAYYEAKKAEEFRKSLEYQKSTSQPLTSENGTPVDQSDFSNDQTITQDNFEDGKYREPVITGPIDYEVIDDTQTSENGDAEVTFRVTKG